MLVGWEGVLLLSGKGGAACWLIGWGMLLTCASTPSIPCPFHIVGYAEHCQRTAGVTPPPSPVGVTGSGQTYHPCPVTSVHCTVLGCLPSVTHEL